MFQQYRKYLKNYAGEKQLLFRLLITAVGISLLGITPIFLMERIVNLASTLDPSKIGSVVFFTALYLLMQVLAATLRGYGQYSAEKIQRSVGSELQRAVYQKLSSADMSKLGDADSINIANGIIQDTGTVSEHLMKPILDLAVSISSFFLAMAYMLKVNLLLTLMVFPLAWITSLVSQRLQSKLESSIEQKREAYGKLFRLFSETIFGIHSIRIFHLVELFRKKIAVTSKNAEVSGLNQAKLEAIGEALLTALFMASIGGILLISSIFMLKGQISFGSMMAVMMYNHMLVDPLLSLIDIQSSMNKGNEAMKRLNPVLELTEQETHYQEYDDLSKIELRDLQFHYPNSPFVLSYRLTVERGEKILLFGSSGIGKSTIAKLIAGLYAPTGGKIIFYRADGNTSDKPLIGYLEQDGYLFDASIRENVSLFAKVIDTERWKNAVRISHIDELCQTYGDQTVGMNGSKLSGGEKKRVLLARAVYKNAPLYIFDELTSSLDSTLARSILEELIQYLQGRTILFIDHSEIVKEYVDRVIDCNQSGDFFRREPRQ